MRRPTAHRAFMSLILGSDILFDRQLLRGRTVGLVCNPASIDAALSSTSSIAPNAAGVRDRRALRPAAWVPRPTCRRT